MRARSDSGFTLVELLVSVSLIGLLSLVLLETVRFTADGYARRLSASDAVAQETDGAASLRAMIESAVPATFLTENGELRVYFEGGSDSLRFVAPAFALSRGPGLAQVTIALTPGEEGAPRRLVARHAAFGLGGEQAVAREVTLATDITGLDLAYYGFPEDGEPGEIQSEQNETQDEAWVDTWRDRASLPALIRLRATSARARDWPVLVIAPRARHPPE